MLDTTVPIDVLRGRPAAERLLALRASGQVPWVCAITVEEVWRRVRPGELRVVTPLLRGLRVATLRVSGRGSGAARSPRVA